MSPAHVRDTNRLRSCRATPATLAPLAGRAEAAAAIWDWRPATGTRGDAAGEASRKRLRGVVQALVTAAVGAVLFFSLRVPAFLAFGLAGLVGVSALVAPTSLFAAIEHAFLGLGRWTGWLLGWVLLVPVFYLFFAPFGRLLRRGRRDRLQRRFDREAPSYWEPHRGLRMASDSHRRQY
jgi:hypothetical protein